LSELSELLKSERKIGYLTDSFTRDFLLRSGFHESRLLPFQSPDEYEEALSNHSIAAVVDETPYLQVFLNKYCYNYTMVNLQNKTSGFGFVSLPQTLHLYLYIYKQEDLDLLTT
jgi:glutamate receptor, ionotropic, plant